MYRTRTCGDLRLADEGLVITLAGWVQKTRKMGGMTFVDIRDRYGITQLVFNQEVDAALCEKANKLGREYVIQVTGTVRERSSKNPNIPTGEIEIIVSELNVLNAAVTPPFMIEDDTDGGDDLRMKYRYLDLRRNAVRKNLELRHRMAFEVRNYLDKQGFLEVETPVLVNSTPEGARDFVVPSRMNPGQFYALPQSPQTLKQLLMVSGFDRYFQIVKCFRDEDLRADRQPEFTQIDCEMSFVEQEDVLNIFEGMAKHLFKVIRGIDIKEAFPRISWHDAMKYYGSDKPDLRFDMKFVELMDIMKGHGFSVFDNAAFVGGICALHRSAGLLRSTRTAGSRSPTGKRTCSCHASPTGRPLPDAIRKVVCASSSHRRRKGSESSRPVLHQRPLSSAAILPGYRIYPHSTSHCRLPPHGHIPCPLHRSADVSQTQSAHPAACAYKKPPLPHRYRRHKQHYRIRRSRVPS